MFHVLLFYKLRTIAHPSHEMKKHKEVCKALQLKGRILIDDRGINGTVAGTKEQVEMYKAYMNQHRLFNKIDFKESLADFMPFPRLQVKVRDEMITTGVKEAIEFGKKAKYVDRDTFHHWLTSGEDMILIDMRNDYEWEVGRFKNAVRPPVRTFKEIFDKLDHYEQYKDKKIVMYCTGGIRCEPATAYFLEKGFNRDNMYHLHGGIVKYAEKYGNEGFFEGKCFVFDDRMVVPIDTSENAVVVGKCKRCETSCDTYRNCANKMCNDLHLSCDACAESSHNTCQDSCKDVISDPTQMRPPRRNNVRVTA
jgi:UPF0176 protein